MFKPIKYSFCGYWGSIVMRIPKLLLYSYKDLFAAINLSLFLIALCNKQIAVFLGTYWQGISPWYSLLFIVILVLWSIMVAIYERDKELYLAYKTMDEELGKFREIPRIEPIYDPDNYPDCRAHFDNNVLYRIGLQNNGNVDVEGVKVKLRVLSPNDPFRGFPIGEQLLKPKDDRDPFTLAKQGFPVHPGDAPKVFVDVAYLKTDGTTELQHVLRDIPYKLRLPIDQYRFSLTIEGQNVSPVSKNFRIEPSKGIIFEE